MTRMDGNVECRICAIRDIRGSPNSSGLLVSIRGLIILLRDLRDEVLKNLSDLPLGDHPPSSRSRGTSAWQADSTDDTDIQRIRRAEAGGSSSPKAQDLSGGRTALFANALRTTRSTSSINYQLFPNPFNL
jgi:hypothetical protein